MPIVRAASALGISFPNESDEAGPARINADPSLAVDTLQIPGTPTVIANGKQYAYLPPLPELRKMIETAKAQRLSRASHPGNYMPMSPRPTRIALRLRWHCGRLVEMLTVALLLSQSTAAAGQRLGAVIVAHAVDGRDGSPLTAVDVSILGTTYAGRTDSLGTIAFNGVAPGRLVVQARRPGFRAVIAEVQSPGSDTLQVALLMRPSAQSLPIVDIVDSSVPAQLQEFEARRRHHTGGFFVDQSVIRKYESTKIDVLLEALIPGVRPTFDRGSAVKVYSTRGAGSLRSGGGTPPCQVEVFLNGVRLSDGDAGIVPLQDLGGIEYYPPGFAPIQYRISAKPLASGGGSGCGVLLLWTRP